MERDPAYRAFLKKNAAEAGRWLVKENETEYLNKLLKNGIFGMAAVEELTEYAIECRQLEAEAMLLEYRNRDTKKAESVDEVIDSRFSL